MSNGYTEEWLRNYQAKHRGFNIEIAKTPKRNKYSAIKTEVDGIIFDSKRESTRYQELRIMQKHGLIHDLRLQVPYLLTVNGQKIAKYIADFQYEEGGQKVVEDAKGVKTPAYRIKKKLLRAIYGIEIRET